MHMRWKHLPRQVRQPVSLSGQLISLQRLRQ